METGLKTILKNNSLNKMHIKALSIQIRLSGLSFCILNTSTNCVEFLMHTVFKKKLTPFEVLEHLKKLIETETAFTQSFNSVHVIHQNDLASLVPKALFDETHIADYLKFNSKILKSDFITYDDIDSNNSVNVYVPYVNINNYIFDNFGEFEYKHASTILIETILQNKPSNEQQFLYVNVDESHFEIVALDKGELLLYNSFEYTTKEDFIYFLLFTVEQLKFNTETLILKLSGAIEKDDALYTIAYKYIRFVEFDKPSKSYTFLPNIKEKEKHQHQLILNSFN
uniref:DUF3822 family protein n=4 Tax=Gelidibacter sp. TaxID=2018083 RepID=UPI00404B9880